MQAIARVNRVFRDKPAGLVVDYIGIAQNLKNALGQYSGADRDQPASTRPKPSGCCLRNTRSSRPCSVPIPRWFDYRPAWSQRRRRSVGLSIMAGAIEWVLTINRKMPPRRPRRKARSARIADTRMQCSRYPRLSRWRRQATRPAASVRKSVSSRRSAPLWLRALTASGNKSAAERELAIQQIVSRAVVSTEIVDILKAAGIETPGYFDSVGRVPRRGAAVTKKNLRSRPRRMHQRRDPSQEQDKRRRSPKRFSERLEAAIARYHTNAITHGQVLEELIDLAKEFGRPARAAKRRASGRGNRLL